MLLRKPWMYAPVTAAAGLAVAMGLATGAVAANASGTTTETVSQVNTMISARCYREVRTEIRYYSHSAGHGWKPLPAPAKTVSITTHCYSR